LAETLVKLFAQITDEAEDIATLLALVRTLYDAGYLLHLSYFYFVLLEGLRMYNFID